MNARDAARRLPDIPLLRNRCRAMATVETILVPDSPYRRHGFDAHWSGTQELAWMDNGGGDQYSVVLSADGAYIRGFDHTSPMSPYRGDGHPWPGLLDSVPEVFRARTREPSFGLDGIPHVTVCLWRETGDGQWRTGDVDFDGGDSTPDGADWLFRFLTEASVEWYQAWAERYYGVPVDLTAVRRIFELQPLTPEIVPDLNPGVTLDGLRDGIAAIGYPQHGSQTTARPLRSHEC